MRPALLCLLLAACAAPPALPPAPAGLAPAPALVPLDPVLAAADAASPPPGDLLARAAALQARVDALRTAQ